MAKLIEIMGKQLIDIDHVEWISEPQGFVRFTSGVTTWFPAPDLKKIVEAKKGPEWPRQ